MSKEKDSESAATAEIDPQLTKAKELNMTWKFGDGEYGLFVVNKTGKIGSPIVHPTSGKQIAVLSAEFFWQETRPFLDHLNYNIRTEKSPREDEAIRRSANFTTLNVNFFKELVQRGSLIKINEFGEKSEPVEKSQNEMMSYAPEIQSQLIDDWLGNFHVERHFPAGTDEVDAMLTNVDTVFFTAKIGNYASPAHVLLFEFNAPSPDARRNFENDVADRGTSQKDGKVVDTLHFNHNARLNFAKKYFKSVEGAINGPQFVLDIDTDALTPIDVSDAESLTLFKNQFNPHWWIELSGALAKAFDFTGK